MTTVVPVYTTIQKEKTILHERSIVSMELYNELQQVLYEGIDGKGHKYIKHIEDRPITFMFIEEGEYIKGCATWSNEKHKQENRCLYGLL